MPITYFPLNVDVSQVVGFPVKVARLEVSTSLPKGTVLAYGSAGQIAVPGGIYNLDGGIGSLTLPTKTGLTNVSDYQYVITGEYSLDGVRPVKMDPIYIDAPSSTAAVNLASFIGVTSAPPTFMGQAVAQLQAKVDEAEAIKAFVTDVSNIDTTVSAVDFALGQPGPAATLNAAIGTLAPDVVGVEKRAPGGAFTTGNVMIMGDFAYATNGIATSAVFGGAVGNENVIGGNLANVDTATSNLTGAPTLTGENGNWNFLLGGYDTVVNGWANSVIGYHCKVEANANHCTISGGSRHVATTTAQYGSIGGGTLNVVTGNNPTVAGGNNNKATNNGATVAGGQNNTASGNGSSVGGGVNNSATLDNATVVGGNTNSATAQYSSVIGGLTNNATATGATVAGGRSNTASGQYSLATGRGAVATEAHQHAHGVASFAVAGDAQVNRWALKKQTTDATAGNLECDTGAPPTIPADTTWAFSALVVARRTDIDGDNAAFEVKGCFKRDAGSTAAFVGTPTITSLGASAGAAAWTVTTGSFSSGTLRLIVTGEAAKTIRWVAELRASSASG